MPPAFRPAGERRVASAAVSSPLPVSARLAWWGTSWLAGHVVTDLLLDAVVGDDVTHAVAGLGPLGLGGPGDTTETLMGGLARLRAEDVVSCPTSARPTAVCARPCSRARTRWRPSTWPGGGPRSPTG